MSAPDPPREFKLIDPRGVIDYLVRSRTAGQSTSQDRTDKPLSAGRLLKNLDHYYHRNIAKGSPVTAPTFNTQAGVRKLRGARLEDQAAGSVVGVAGEATSPLVTRDGLKTELAGVESRLRADMYRALWMQGVGIVAVGGGIVAILEAIG